MSSMTTVQALAPPDRCWHFSVPHVPVSVNHQYVGRRNGGKALSPEALSIRNAFTLEARLSGFHPALRAQYAVRLRFTVPGWGRDLDNLAKGALDAIFGGGRDHRIVRLELEKVVRRGVWETEVWIEDLR